MAELENVVNTAHKLVIHAVPNGENDKCYSWISWEDSPMPPWAKTIDNPDYKACTEFCLKVAEEAAIQTKKPIKITFEYFLEYQQ